MNLLCLWVSNCILIYIMCWWHFRKNKLHQRCVHCHKELCHSKKCNGTNTLCVILAVVEPQKPRSNSLDTVLKCVREPLITYLQKLIVYVCVLGVSLSTISVVNHLCCSNRTRCMQLLQIQWFYFDLPLHLIPLTHTDRTICMKWVTLCPSDWCMQTTWTNRFQWFCKEFLKCVGVV